mmetsp:Transcript_20052/g.25941  ORF Transcript_20052/g.25941 Transcript_20052/m.25941 type:complete len:543 (+) Transcript_20052:80-1708(+)
MRLFGMNRNEEEGGDVENFSDEDDSTTNKITEERKEASVEEQRENEAIAEKEEERPATPKKEDDLEATPKKEDDLEPIPTPTKKDSLSLSKVPTTPDDQKINPIIAPASDPITGMRTPEQIISQKEAPNTEPQKSQNSFSDESPPCNNFVLDLNSNIFNACKHCGQPRIKHTDYSRASEELRGKWNRKKSLTPSDISQKDLDDDTEVIGTNNSIKKACTKFELDVDATTFNTCKNCGLPKISHNSYSRASEELKCKLVTRKSESIIERPKSEVNECCDNFTRDLTGTSFDTCICGFSKSAHENKMNWNGANDELASKLQRRPSNGLPLTTEDNDENKDPPTTSSIISAIKTADLSKLTEILAQEGLDLSVTTEDEETPLQLASSQGSAAMVKLLLDHGAPLDLENPVSGLTPLATACAAGKLENATMLLSRSANPASTDKNRQTPLHHASANGHTSCCQLLLKHSSDIINLTDDEKRTALHMAAEKGHTLCVKLLCDKGADTKIKNKHNATPLDLAIKHKHTEVATCLRQADTAPGCKCLIS